MKLVNNISAAIMALLFFSSCNTQIKNATTESVKIYGNCGMCESTIEKAGNMKNVVQVDWNKDTKMATLTYDASKTNQEEILKRIALAGYDSDEFLAPDDVYNNLPGCCQYDRVKKTEMSKTEVVEDHSMHEQNEKSEVPKTEVVQDHSMHKQNEKSEVPKTEVVEDHSMHNHNEAADKPTKTKQEINQLKAVFDDYFALKDALVKSDGNLASTKAKELLASIKEVEMSKLTTEEHTVWMKVVSSLKLNTDKISATTNLDSQRNIFMIVSANFYDLLKVSKQETPVYYQHCPMYNDGEGANWLSKENAVKNPYYGSEMLSCGKTVETIK